MQPWQHFVMGSWRVPLYPSDCSHLYWEERTKKLRLSHVGVFTKSSLFSVSLNFSEYDNSTFPKLCQHGQAFSLYILSTALWSLKISATWLSCMSINQRECYAKKRKYIQGLLIWITLSKAPFTQKLYIPSLSRSTKFKILLPYKS